MRAARLLTVALLCLAALPALVCSPETLSGHFWAVCLTADGLLFSTS